MVMAILDCIDLLKKNSSTQILKVKYTDIFFTRQQLLANKSYLKILGRSRLICWTTSLLKLGEKNQNNNCNIYKTVSYLNFYMYFFLFWQGSMKVGGGSEVIRINSEGKRLDFWK